MIEYKGLLIRPVLEDVLESRYEAQGQDSSYLFRYGHSVRGVGHSVRGVGHSIRGVGHSIMIGGRAPTVCHPCLNMHSTHMAGRPGSWGAACDTHAHTRTRA